MSTIEKVSCFPNEGTPQVIAGDPADGDLVRITTDSGSVVYQRYTAPVVRSPVPQLLSKTTFQDYAWSQLGGGTTGMARFNQIMVACRDGTDLLQACYDRYQADDTFLKSKVSDLTAIMVAGSAMTSAERDAVLNNWPTV